MRTPKRGEWIICRSFLEFTQLISEQFGKYENPTLCDLEISFDHDLGNEFEKTGHDCAKWLIEQNIILKKFNAHSANPVGAENILFLLNNWNKHNGIL